MSAADKCETPEVQIEIPKLPRSVEQTKLSVFLKIIKQNYNLKDPKAYTATMPFVVSR